jgi:hypothetical protein
MRIRQLHDCVSGKLAEIDGYPWAAGAFHVFRARWQCLDLKDNLAERMKRKSRRTCLMENVRHCRVKTQGALRGGCA